MGDMVDRIALAIKAETDKFSAPVRFYIEPEAGKRWEAANPDKDYILDGPNDDLESYRIIARAVIEAQLLQPAEHKQDDEDQ